MTFTSFTSFCLQVCWKTSTIPEFYNHTVTPHHTVSLSVYHSDTSNTTFVSSLRQDRTNIPNFMWNNKAFTTKVEEKLNRHFVVSIQSTNPENELSQLFKTMKELSESCMDIFGTKYHTVTPKPWWTKELSSPRDNLQLMFNSWRDAGFNKSPDDVTYCRYLFARKRFRKLVKQQKNQLSVNHYINIEKLKKTKPMSFWKHVRLNNSSEKMFNINKKTDAADITNEFKQHFSKLLTTPKVESINNEESNKDLFQMLNEPSPETQKPFTSHHNL